ncbi:PAS domain S-box protein [Streptomyces sp. NPDC059786]|uniref:PAS domain S-box protein n=1 Tax=Streptomyces sp. NPDC059786 TaxID=3346946 RepID=UPI0036503264
MTKSPSAGGSAHEVALARTQRTTGSTTQRSTTQHGIARQGATLRSTARHGPARHPGRLAEKHTGRCPDGRPMKGRAVNSRATQSRMTQSPLMPSRMTQSPPTPSRTTQSRAGVRSRLRAVLAAIAATGLLASVALPAVRQRHRMPAPQATAQVRVPAVDGLAAAGPGGARDTALYLGILLAVTALALVLRRFVSRPLQDVSQGARALAEGDLSYDVEYRGKDGIGAVAETLRELRTTSERLAAEIRTMNTAMEARRFGHRADAAAFEGAWAQLLDGMNATMASVAAAHDRLRKAERELDSVFTLSLDPLCIFGPDGRFKRVSPAFESTLGYSAAELRSRPWIEFVHAEDRARTRTVLSALNGGVEHVEFENRCLRADGTARWLQWSARRVPGEGLVHATAHDVTDSRRAGREEAALRRVATLVARGVSPDEMFTSVAHEVGLVLSSASAAVLRYEADGGVTVLGSAYVAASEASGDRAAAVEWAASEHAVRAGCAAREESALPEARSVGAPIVVDDRLWGVVVAASAGAEPMPVGTAAQLTDFTELVAVAIANADARAQLTASRARVVASADASRRRIERDLHDGVQQRLVSLQLDLRTAESMAPVGAGELNRQLAHIGKGLDDTFEELLQVSRGIHPAILSRGGLAPALRALARRSAIPVELAFRLPPARLPERIEVAVYYVASECLTNAAKHARAGVVRIEGGIEEVPEDGTEDGTGTECEGAALEVSISDDGVGGAEPRRGSGLVGLTDRVEAIGGRLSLVSLPGDGTTVTVRLPLETPSADK